MNKALRVEEMIEVLGSLIETKTGAIPDNMIYWTADSPRNTWDNRTYEKEVDFK